MSPVNARFVVGIDLGTTHCAVAASPVDRAQIQLFEVPQLVAPGEVAPHALLPSFAYLPAEGELRPGELALPWRSLQPGEPIVGRLAQRLGAQVPVRLVASAKSWICHGGVNRRAPILPWAAPDEAPHISPFEASALFLAHLREAWDAGNPSAPLAHQDVVITVPASFDSVARALTVEAAQAAGLPQVRLLEEPQAAFYDFLSAHEADLEQVLGGAQLVLVIDVGGGTTDLTLVRVARGESLSLERVAVGGHLVLGGDNMDAALAHHVLQALGLEGRLDPTEWSALVQSARAAKERLLAADAPSEAVVTVQRRGARLMGGTRSVTLSREVAHRILLDGFLPKTRPDEIAERRGRAGLTTLGLPYVTDPAIPRHVCAFLRRHVQAATEAGAQVVEGLPRPDVLLLNGGVFNAPAMIERLDEVMTGWFGEPVPLLAHTSLDTAVARGAAAHGLVRRGFGRAIGGGSARAYYLGVEGAGGQPRAFCVAPRGMEEGASVEVRDRSFDLVLGRLVNFPLYAYTGDRADPAGQLIDVSDELEPLPPVETVLRASEKEGRAIWVSDSGSVPVRISATLSESGTLALYLVTVELPPHRWRLEFALGGTDRPEPAAPPAPEPDGPSEPLPKAFDEARRLLERVFGGSRQWAAPERARGLRQNLESLLGPRGAWSSAVCRALWGACVRCEDRRGRSPEHERSWLRLAGWCLRPGFGAQGDGARMEAMWDLYGQGLAHAGEKANWVEWWVLWRRIAAGLTPAQQGVLFEAVRPWLEGGRPPPGPRAHGHPEMLRMLAALEHLSADQKVLAGRWFMERFKKVGSWWPLGRLGARHLFHGDPADVVPAEIAAGWLERLLDLDWARAQGAAFAAVQLARIPPPRSAGSSVEGALRQRVIDRLQQTPQIPARWIELVGQAEASTDARRVFGEALPAGLRLR